MRKLFPIFLLYLITACGSESFDCMKQAGELQKQQIEIEWFNKLMVYDETDIILSQGPEIAVWLEAGENLIPSIEFKFLKGQLSIYNKNYCNWVRDKSKPKIYITVPDLKEVELYDYGNLESSHQLAFKKLSLLLEGTGDVTLDLNTDTLILNSNFVSRVELTGVTGYFQVETDDDSQVWAENLRSDQVKVVHNGSNFIKVFPQQVLWAEIIKNGTIYSYNEPPEVNLSNKGPGRLIFVPDS
ncbi:MAG: head GIN domain-containing protein [Candidatus Cyclobacteriaceae bacterium M3_2C_046]